MKTAKNHSSNRAEDGKVLRNGTGLQSYCWGEASIEGTACMHTYRERFCYIHPAYETFLSWRVSHQRNEDLESIFEQKRVSFSDSLRRMISIFTNTGQKDSVPGSFLPNFCEIDISYIFGFVKGY